MNNKNKLILRNISVAFTANIISLLVSVLMNLIVPHSVGVEEYAYWQLYIFYSGYVIYLNLGWSDGIYLKYAGKTIKYLKQENVNNQICFLAIYEIVISMLICFYAYFTFNDSFKFIIFVFSLISGIIIVLRITLQYLLQATNQINRYSLTVIVDRVIFLIIVVVLFFLKKDKFYHLVVADLLSKIVSMTIALYFCKDVFKFDKIKIRSILVETVDLIKGGIKLISSNFIGILIIGLIRFSILNNWGTIAFGQISLTLSISNLVTQFIGTIGMVLFPILRNVNIKSLKRGYSLLRTSLSVTVLGALAIYKPIYYFLVMWLPEYSTALEYMAILLPITYFEGKNNLITAIYLKTIRKEKWILISNIITIILCFILIYLCVYRLNNFDYTVYSILIVLAFRSSLMELVLGNLININVMKNITIELLVVVFFLISNSYFYGILSICVYLCVYILYIIFKRNEIKNLMEFTRR